MALAFNKSMPSPRQHDFSRATPPSIQRSVFNRSTTHKTPIDPGYLYPLLVDELLPADTVNLSATIFARLNPMVVPPMDNLHLDLHAYFVPARLLWKNWVKLMGEQKNPGDSIDYVVPPLRAVDLQESITFQTGSIFDYMGLPVNVPIQPSSMGGNPEEAIDISALPLRAYNLIWNEWYRDQNFQDSVPQPDDDGPDLISNYALLRRGKRHDYITSSLPSPQKGPAVTISLAGTAPIVGNGEVTAVYANEGDESALFLNNYGVEASTLDNPVTPAAPMLFGSQVGLNASLSAVSVFSINEIRVAATIQQLLELYSRSGTRYTEILSAEFKVTAEDFRLQRPEFLGGSSQIVGMEVVPQTSAPEDGSPQGSLAANGNVVTKLRVSYNVKEHGYILILASVRADLTYQQGLRKMWSRRTRYDFYHPAFANLGEQAVLRKEFQVLDADAWSGYNNGVWGYQERYAEYRYFPSLITGKFRSIADQSLDAWHYGIDTDGVNVQLDENFIKDEPQLRALAYTTEPAFFVDSYFDIKHARPMPVFSVPGLRRF